VHIAFPPTVDGVNHYGLKEIVDSKFDFVHGIDLSEAKPTHLLSALSGVVTLKSAVFNLYTGIA